MSILVRAAAGLKVPMEGNPHRYIDEHQAVAVEESAYYLRCLEVVIARTIGARLPSGLVSTGATPL